MRCRSGRRATGLLWVGGLLALTALSLPVGVPSAGMLAPGQAEDDLPPPPASRDTTGQAALRWQVQRPQRQASLLQADRTIYRSVDGEAISFYYGNVYLDRDTVVVRADSAHVYRGRNLVRLFDNVRLRHHRTRVASDWAEYRRDLGEADLRGHVRVVEDGALVTGNLGELRDDLQLLRVFDDAVFISPDYTVRADTLVRDRRLEHAEAFGNVRVMDPEASSLVTGDHALFSADGTWAEVDRNPTLETREEGGQPVLSDAGNMRFYQAEERVVMTDSVRIHQGEMRAFADTAISFGRERMLLLGDPRLEQGERSRMYGDQIEFFYRDGDLHRVILLGNARMEDSEPDSMAAIYRGLPDEGIIEGDSIAVHFDEGEITHTDVVGRAYSIYVPMDVESEIAFNEVQGDTLVLRFRERRIHQVEVRGNMTGTYHFASLAKMVGPAAAALDSTAVDSLTAMADSLMAAGDTLEAAAVAAQIEAASDLLAVSVDSLAALADSVLAVAPDSLVVMADSLVSVADSLAVDLAEAISDTLDFASNAEQVQYSGHSVLFDLPERTITIETDANLEYGTMNLSAQTVILDTETRELYADGDPLIQDSETIVGKQMGYDFGNKTGAVRTGVTTFDGYYYAGKHINRYPDGSLKINSGTMTSCDLAEPHYHFWGDKMKMRLGDKVVGAPIVMKVGHVPVFALPFYFKSLKEGRRSGILFPNFNFGWSEREGRYIRDLGYFWATNDYTDFTFELDYNERREITWRVRNRYVKRYAFTGSFEYNQLKNLDDSSVAGEWQLRWRHDQPELFDDYKFRADVDMASTELSRDNLDRNTGRDIISGQLKSTVYVSRNWSWGGGSVNAERTEFTNAGDDDPETDRDIYNMLLPSLSLNFRQLTLGRQLGPGEEGSFLGDLGRSTFFTQSYRGSNQQSATEETETLRNTANGSWGLTVRPPRLGIFNWNVGASSSWAWTRTEVEGREWIPEEITSEGDTIPGYWIDIDDITETSRPALSFNSGLNTTLYGVFPAAIGPLRAIRHTLSLSGSVSYRPQLGSKQQSGNTYSVSMGNRFDIKYLGDSESDSTRVEKKLDGLFDWSLSASYNPDPAPGQKEWSNVGSGLTFRPGRHRNLAFKMTNSIDPYRWKVLSTRFNYGFGFSGRFDTGFTGQEREDGTSDAISRLGPAEVDSMALARADSIAYERELDAEFFEPGDDPYGDDPLGDDPYSGLRGALGDGPGGLERDDTEGGRFIPWNLTGSFSLNHNAETDQLTSRANLGIQTQITRDWSLRYTASFDLAEGSTTRQEYRLARDLHCWRVEFTRTVGFNSEFGFRFYLKAIPDLKLTRGRDDLLGSTQSVGSLF